MIKMELWWQMNVIQIQPVRMIFTAILMTFTNTLLLICSEPPNGCPHSGIHPIPCGGVGGPKPWLLWFHLHFLPPLAPSSIPCEFAFAFAVPSPWLSHSSFPQFKCHLLRGPTMTNLLMPSNSTNLIQCSIPSGSRACFNWSTHCVPPPL